MSKAKDQLTYYNGFSDGIHTTNMAVLAMLQKVNELTDVNTIKLVIAHTGKIIADITDETNDKLDALIILVKEEDTHGME